jgi:hypothetical protein
MKDHPTDPIDQELCDRNLAFYNKYTGKVQPIRNAFYAVRETLRNYGIPINNFNR